MTQKTSFKSRMKQAFSFFRSDLRACTPLLVVFGLISAVTVVICYTICVVLGEDMTFTGALLSLNFLGVTNSGTGIIEIFQYSSANLIYLISIIFTIIYTVRIYSYLHNKRKADLYGSLPIGRSTLFVTKTASAYLMSIIPTLFFLGVISIITVCTGNSVISELSSMFLKICLGTLASISFFGLIAICCGTMLNSVLMFIAVCVAYPLSAIFIKGIVVGCFDGFYVGIFIPPSVLHNQGACFIPCRHVPRCAFRFGECSGRICGFCFRIYSCKRSRLHNRSSYFVQRLFKAYQNLDSARCVDYCKLRRSCTLLF